jgi:hypothetical protein
MRSLTPTGLYLTDLDSAGPSTFAGNLAVNPENGVIYIAVQKGGEDVEVDIIQVDLTGSVERGQKVSLVYLDSWKRRLTSDRWLER